MAEIKSMSGQKYMRFPTLLGAIFEHLHKKTGKPVYRTLSEFFTPSETDVAMLPGAVGVASILTNFLPMRPRPLGLGRKVQIRYYSIVESQM